jgi:hypothetical protein
LGSGYTMYVTVTVTPKAFKFIGPSKAESWYQPVKKYFWIPDLADCSSDADCKGSRRCVTPSDGRDTKQICAHIPGFECKRDEECKKGRKCVAHKKYKEIK